MKRFVALMSVLLASTALQAQVSGSINRNAPKVSTSIAMGDHKVELSYTSIRFGEGQWQQILENEGMHERFNQGAERRPVGSVKTNCALMAAGKVIPAGDYQMFFTVHPQAGWILNLKPAEGEAIRWRMVLKATDHAHSCMRITLEPSAEDGECALTIAFGSQMVSVPVTVQDEDK